MSKKPNFSSAQHSPSGTHTRRQTLSVLGSVGFTLTVLGCSKDKPLVCNEGLDLSPEHLQQRHKVVYVDKSPKPELACGRCAQYVEAKGNECGTCKVMPGPTNPEGSCKLFQPTV